MVASNLQEACNKWVQMSRVLEREGAGVWTLGTFFKSVVRAVILVGSETWVLTPYMGLTMVGFQHRVAHRLMGKQPRRIPDDGWEYPLPGVSNLGGGTERSGVIYHTESEFVRTVHCEAVDYGSM